MSNHLQAFSLLLATILTGCDVSRDEIREGGGAVAFKTSLGETITRAAKTPTTLDNIWPDNTRISVLSSEVSVPYTYTTGSSSASSASGTAVDLTPVSGVYRWPITDPNWTFTAWYPAGNTVHTGITVSADQSTLSETDYLKYDLLYCPKTTATFEQTVALKFHHQMARVIVKVNSDNTEKKEKVTSISFGGGRVKLTGQIDNHGTDANGSTTWKDLSGTASIKMRLQDADDTNHEYTYECILPPQTDATTTTELVGITTSGAVDNGNNPITRTYIYRSDFTLQSGYQYTYYLSISESGSITIATVHVTPWETGSTTTNTATIPDNSYPD